jgi:hypothetical protein
MCREQLLVHHSAVSPHPVLIDVLLVRTHKHGISNATHFHSGIKFCKVIVVAN